MPDVEGHPIVAKLGRLAGSPTPPPSHKSPTLALKRRFNVAPRRRGRRRRKQRRLAGGTLGSTGGLQAGGRTGPRRPQAARTGPRRPQAARGIGRLPTQPMCICCLYIYIYIYVCICVFSGRGTTTLVDTLSSKSSAHVVASGTQQGAAVQKIAAEFCDFEFGGCTSSRTTERRSAGFGGSHPLSSPGLGAPTPYSQARRVGGLPLPTSPSWGLPMGSHPLKTPGAFTPLNSPGLGAPTP